MKPICSVCPDCWDSMRSTVNPPMNGGVLKVYLEGCGPTSRFEGVHLVQRPSSGGRAVLEPSAQQLAVHSDKFGIDEAEAKSIQRRKRKNARQKRYG